VLTFLNYWNPNLWGCTSIPNTSNQHVVDIGRGLGCPITYTSTGPLPENLIKVQG
jgi:adenylosuccinate synthase